ncbi:MAG: HDIG domain-containing protein [Bacteroidaceae bacterium]|nr:HDIG domain-containing protein [Bacteroidaceae bacterium]
MWSRYKLLSRFLLVVICSAIIVYFMPHEHNFTYDYAVGKPWKYSQIIAEYDFPIYKSEAQLKAERDSVLRNLKPFFKHDSSVGELQVDNFKRDFSTNLSLVLNHKERLLLTRLLASAYDRGITSQHDYSLVIDSVKAISIVSGGAAQVKAVSTILSPRLAYEMIVRKADSLHLSKEVVARCNINNYIAPNLIYDSERTALVRKEALSNIVPSHGLVQSGQKIIDRGEIVTDHTMKVLQSLQKETEKRSESGAEAVLLILGQFLCVILLMNMFMAYLVLYRPDYASELRSVGLLLSLILLFTVAAQLVQQPTELNVYIVPFAIVPIFIRVFMDSRTAFAAMVTIVSICSLSLHSPYEFMLLEIVAGLTAIYSLRELTSRSQLFRTVLLITALTALIKLGYDLSQGFILSTIDPSWYERIAISGVLLLFAYPLMLLFEKMFGFISSVTLVELSNVNTPLLRQMSKEAQGTFNHSMQVANLSAEVAGKIGANVQLVRTAALYHDIGKLQNPAFFTENQSGTNPHDDLPEEQSAQIIIRHVADGIEMAEKHRLPSVIKECIATHHGRSKAKFFYVNYVNKHPDEPVNEELFTYPGPNPQTKEQAILMMADSTEAASRSLAEKTETSIRDLVNKIIDQQVADGCFSHCPITFQDVATAKEVLVSSLKTIYHARISYPDLEKPKENTENSENNETLRGD